MSVVVDNSDKRELKDLKDRIDNAIEMGFDQGFMSPVPGYRHALRIFKQDLFHKYNVDPEQYNLDASTGVFEPKHVHDTHS